MTNLLNFFAEAATEGNQIGTFVIFGVLIIAIIFMSVIPRRKNKKAQEEMKAKLKLGCEITTIGGIVGTLIELTDTHFVITTGSDADKTTMKFVRQAIHSIAADPNSPEGMAIAKAEEKQNDEIDEIK